MNTATENTKPTWTPDETTVHIVEKYGHLLNNTGGNDPIDLLRRLATNENLMTVNLPVAVLAIAVLSQIRLLARLEKEGLL